MRSLLEEVARGYDGFVELRYHNKVFRSLLVSQGRVEKSTVRHRKGVGVRVLVNGTWGFASTSDCSAPAIRAAVETASASAKASSSYRKAKIPALPATGLAVGDFAEPGVTDILERPMEEKLQLALDTESRVRAAASSIQTASCGYNEIFTEKAIVTSDGASAAFKLIRPEFRVSAVAERDGSRSSGAESIGVTGGWECLFRDPAQVLVERAAKTAVDLLDATIPEGGRSTVILSPSIVGLLVHEAVGHTVEADFVMSGSVAKGKLGTRVASDLVTLCDSGRSELASGAGGCIPVDDEGVIAGETVIIKDGLLNSYLHNRESAAHYGVAPTGNARAWEYADQPLIRMRNTYIRPGQQSLEEIIASTEDGYLLDGPRNGQADATGEFMFGVQRAYRIKNGRIGDVHRGVTLSGKAFDVLQTVDAVSNEFLWDLGSGHCGKGQPAKVDAGGPYIRCQAMLGGQQSA
ncbi:MAG: TldD/PmbA family protein [Myxococcota bacterium]|nr:TldD/PmbA family protein [Myxococcota bacterium]